MYHCITCGHGGTLLNSLMGTFRNFCCPWHKQSQMAATCWSMLDPPRKGRYRSSCKRDWPSSDSGLESTGKQWVADLCPDCWFQGFIRSSNSTFRFESFWLELAPYNSTHSYYWEGGIAGSLCTSDPAATGSLLGIRTTAKNPYLLFTIIVGHLYKD